LAVYTEIGDEELLTFLAQYAIGDLHSIKGIAEGVENSNFLLTTDDGPFILTLYEKRVDVCDLPFFIGLMRHLSANSINCPQPIAMRTGKLLGNLSARPAAIVSFLDGFSIRRPTLNHCRQLGAMLARMHLAAQGFDLMRPNALGMQAWQPLFQKSAERADEVEPGLAETINSELQIVSANWPVHLPTGVIHADLFPDNVFFLKNELSGLIDFYFACNDLLAYDIAVCLNAWCFEPDCSFNVTKAKALLSGYFKVRQFDSAEYSALPMLCRGAALRFLLTRLYDWLNVPDGALVTPKDPREYLAKLRFHQKIEHADAYGLEHVRARAAQ
jgi:homoserine kinase type II